MLPIIDIGFSVSTIMALVSVYGFLLFAGCWYYKKEASAVYVYVTFMLLGMSIDNACEAYAKFIWINYGVDEFRRTFWWPMRLLVEMMAVMSLIGHMSYRAFFLNNGRKE